MTPELLHRYHKEVETVIKEAQTDLCVTNGKHIAVNNVYNSESEYLWESQIVLDNEKEFQILAVVGVRDFYSAPTFVAKYFYKEKLIERFI